VTVIVREVNSSRVFVTGEVAHPGAYPLRGRVSLLQAIALAGGFTDFANSDGMVIIRTDGKGGQIPVRYSDLISPDGGQDLVLRPGDTIVVP
jgi:polysaccharide export outer membrane protein